MIRSLYFLIFYFIITTLAIPVALFSGVFKLLRLRSAERFYVGLLARILSRTYIALAGARVIVEGGENCEGLKGEALCVVSNHQGMADIPVIITSLPFSIGFVAKRSLLYFPWVGIMMWAIRCVPLDRSSPRSAVKAIEKGVENIRNGFPMMIFPEGTRSRGPEMKPFKKGSLKLATRSGAIILPVTVNGSYRLLEAKGRLQPGVVHLRIHPPIPTAHMDRTELGGLHSRIETVIASGLES
jgi:1-acyl-sn-glycerol-3-phosphate acyltransferase